MRILVIRRDNIGDLICTTPLFSALRQAYPQAWIGVLANAYNAPILAGNPDIDSCFAYRKAKHRTAGESRFAVWRSTAALLWKLRRMQLDLVLCASPGAQRFARLLGARRIIEAGRSGAGHETEITNRLLTELGLSDKPGKLVLRSGPAHQAGWRSALRLGHEERCLAIHISARKPAQRWPIERYAEFIRRVLATDHVTRVLLFWAPGDAADPLHPGDDNKAAQLLEILAGLPVTPVPTHTLKELVAGLALADSVICSDGGAMHVAAGLGKPIVCFFGNSSAERWHPWGVPYELLQKPSLDVTDISVDEAHAAFLCLQERIRRA
ncbi:MAG: glycosyltransferase family 9 protein [Rhodocyclaceae bacterium]|nr:glycosyltransferase family 9 protein [Rhodocyclaceae bacterium]MDZ4215951.1 glycosyltransferase family 9 protein [Rhodocyclaceae bacterium]